MRVHGQTTKTLRNPAINGAAVWKPASEAERRFGTLLEDAPDAIIQFDSEGRIVFRNRMAEQLFGYTRDESPGQTPGQTIDALVPNILREEVEHRFRQMIESVTEYAIFTLDPEGNVTSWNAGAQKIKGYTAEEIVGKHFAIFYPPEVRGTTPAQELALVRRAGKFEEEGWRLRKDGSRFWASVVITPVRSLAGDVVGFLKLTRDLTERKHAEERLRRTSEALKDFAYAASHDLQEPLRMIKIYSELLATRYSSKLDAAGDQFIGFVMEGAVRMDALLRGLREYWQASECAEEHYRPVHSGDALSCALLNLQENIATSGAALTFDSLPVVWAEQVLLVQLFQNLVGNAIKYRGEKAPEIRVTAEQNEMQEWVFSVRDNGIGIDPKYAQKIFDMFNRLHGNNYPGSGIGLAICRRVVERLGGRIWVESMPGCGADFKFTIPTHAAVTAGG